MKKILLTTSAIVLGISTFSQSAMADVDTNTLILKQLEALQKQVATQNAEIARLKANAANNNTGTDDSVDEVEEYVSLHEEGFHIGKVKIGGWADFLYSDNDIEGNNQITSPDALFITFDAQLDSKWRFFTELSFEGGPFSTGDDETEGELSVERMYLEYGYSDLLNARIGKFSTPVGIWPPEHWTFNVPSVNTPFFVDEEHSYLPLYNIGIEGFGKYTVPGENKWAPDLEYHTWISGGDKDNGTITPQDDKLGHGANVSATFNEMIKVGLGYNNRTHPHAGNRREFTLMPHVELYLPQNVTVTAEYLAQDRNQGFADVEAWYSSIKWDFADDMYSYYRRDQGENDVNGFGANEDTNTFTLGYSPKPFIRTKLEYSTHEFEDVAAEDYNQWSAWIGVAF